MVQKNHRFRASFEYCNSLIQLPLGIMLSPVPGSKIRLNKEMRDLVLVPERLQVECFRSSNHCRNDLKSLNLKGDICLRNRHSFNPISQETLRNELGLICICT